MKEIFAKRLIITVVIGVLFIVTAVYGESVQEMRTLFQQGMQYYSQSDFRKAAPKLEQALKITKSIKNKRYEGVLLTNLGLVYAGLGDYPKALSCYEQALKIHREIGNRKGEGANLNNLGIVYRNFGDYPKALSYYEQALKIDREIGDRKGEGADLTNLGIIYHNLGDYPKAISYQEQALKIHREIGNREGEGDNLGNLGIVYWELGDYPKALSYYEQALKIEREIGNRQGEGNNLGNLGIVYHNLGDYPKALSYYEQALKIYREIGDRQGEGGNLISLGIIYGDLGDYPKALSYHEQALKIHREIGDRRGEGDDLGNFGSVYRNLGDYPKTLSYLEQALKIYREIGDRKEEGATLSNLGTIYGDLGDYPKALFYLEQALKIKREIGAPTGIEEANMADVWLKQGEIKKAEAIHLRLGDPIRLGNLNLVKQNYKKAIEYFDKALEKNLQSRDAVLLFANYAGLGQAYEGLRDHPKAGANYEKAVALAEEQREGLGKAEKSRFFAAEVAYFKRIGPYEGMIRANVEMNNPQEAFLHSEHLKARLLSEAIAGRSSGPADRLLPSVWADEEQNYITRIRGLRKQLEALYRNKAMDTYYEREKELKTAKAKQKEFIRRLRAAYPEYASLHYPEPIKADEVTLEQNETLIAFEVMDEATLLFMLRAGELKTRKILISREELQALVLEYRGFFEGITKTDQLLQYKPEAGRKLYALLFGNMLQPVAEGSVLIVVPDEFLGILPFEALVTELPATEKVGDGEYGPFPLGVEYLGDRFLVSYAQSATSLTLLRTLKKEGTSDEKVLVVADPIFSANDSRLAAVARAEVREESLNLMGAIADWKQMGVTGVRAKEQGRASPAAAEDLFPRLEKTSKIAEGMESLFGQKTKVLLGIDAREDKVVKADLSKYHHLIFATHGILDNTVPWIREPALVLTQVGNPDGYDGFLTMSEVMGLKLGAEMVTLTACETGVGKNVSGEGVMGMGRAFQYAGAGNVLVSLWSVAETSTTKLTTAFFKHLKEGNKPLRAIRLARSDIRRQGYEHPFYWASFILFGN